VEETDGDNEEDTQWLDLKEALFFLHPQERFILRLLRDGKGVSDVAMILGMDSRQHAAKEVERTITILKFFLKHMNALRKLYLEVLPLTRRQIIVLRMYVMGRLSQTDIAKKMGYTSRWAPWDHIKEIKKKLKGTAHVDVFRLISESSTRQWLRRKRWIMTSENWRSYLALDLVAMLGKVWYVWGGQDLKKGEADCSGLVIEMLKKYDRLPEDTPDVTAQGLSKMYRITKKPLPGDLAFYGRNWNRVTHVMFHIGAVENMTKAVAGMCGGRRGMDKKLAKKLGSALWLKTSYKYRRDFLGFRKVV